LSLGVGFDLDGVLADTDSALVSQAAALFGDKLAYQQVPAAPPDREGPPEPAQ
jgi:FMN phosphatase YigB (HAD superfamily)